MAKPVDCAHIRKERDLLIANLIREINVNNETDTFNVPNLFATIGRFVPNDDILGRRNELAQYCATMLTQTRNDNNTAIVVSIVKLFRSLLTNSNRIVVNTGNLKECYDAYLKILLANLQRCMSLYWYRIDKGMPHDKELNNFQMAIDKFNEQNAIYDRVIVRLTCDQIQAKIRTLLRQVTESMSTLELEVQVTEKVRKIITGTKINFSELQAVLYSERSPTPTTANKTNQPTVNFGNQAIATLDAIRLDTANLKSCYEVYVNVYFPIFLCFNFLTGLNLTAPTDSEDAQQVLYELEMEDMMRDLPVARPQSILPGKTALTKVQEDINRLLEHGDVPIEDAALGLDQMTFDVRTLEALDTSALRDYFGKNKYFNLEYGAKKKIKVKPGIYGLRYLKDVAVLLQAAITTSTGIKPLRYASPEVDVELNKLLDDINYNFAYIKPRLNLVTTELFSSPKATAITRALNPIKALNKAEGKYNIPAIKAKIIKVLDPIREEIVAARTAAKQHNTKGTMNTLKDRKEAYGVAVADLLKKANFEVERKMIREERDKVLKEWDSWTRTKYLFTGKNTEGGKRTRKNRH